MKHSLLIAALLSLAVSACAQKEETAAPATSADIPAVEQSAAPVAESVPEPAEAPAAADAPAPASEATAAPVVEAQPAPAETK